MIRVLDLLGIGSIPNDRSAASSWLRAKNIVVAHDERDRRRPALVHLSDLPEPERLAYLRRELDAAGLDMGARDDDAHDAYLAAKPKARAEAERRAAMVRVVKSLPEGTSWSDRLRLVCERLGSKGTSERTVQRHLETVEGVDPINWAPALLPAHKGRTETAAMSGEAWSCFMTLIRDAAPDWPLISAWRDVRDMATAQGWEWPAHSTCYRRWKALSASQRMVARYGPEETAKRLTQSAMRDKTTIRPLEWVSLDGRTQDFWADFGDGRAVRPVMLAVVDVASNVVLDWTLARSENAVETVRLIRRVCQSHGIFDRLYTDNGSAFAGHLVAGGNVHRFRNAGKRTEGVRPLGICHHLGIQLHFALPKNAQAKTAERTFASLSRVIDDRPEFKGAHAGHAPGAAPATGVVPIDIETVRRIVGREIRRHNAEPGRRGQGARGRSYDQIFAAGLATRIVRKPTAGQVYLASLIYTPAAVDKQGRITVNGWTYGDPLTQDELLEYCGKGQRVLLGRNPDDFSQPALAYNEDGALICGGIAVVKRGKYDSKDGIRTAARNRKAARQKVAAAEAANNYLADQELAAALTALDPEPSHTPAPAPPKIVGTRFGGPLKARKATEPEPINSVSAITPEMWENLDRRLGIARPAKSGR